MGASTVVEAQMLPKCLVDVGHFRLPVVEVPELAAGDELPPRTTQPLYRGRRRSSTYRGRSSLWQEMARSDFSPSKYLADSIRKYRPRCRRFACTRILTVRLRPIVCHSSSAPDFASLSFGKVWTRTGSGCRSIHRMRMILRKNVFPAGSVGRKRRYSMRSPS